MKKNIDYVGFGVLLGICFIFGLSLLGDLVAKKCSYDGCNIKVEEDEKYCFSHQFADYKQKKSNYKTVNKSSRSNNKSKSSTSGSSSTSETTTNSSSKKKTTKSSSKKSNNPYKSYDEGYEDVYDNDDYDWDRYYSDDDYADGVDDAMEDLDDWGEGDW